MHTDPFEWRHIHLLIDTFSKIQVSLPVGSRGSWGNAKTFEFEHKKDGKETPGIISDGVFLKPGQLSLKHT